MMKQSLNFNSRSRLNNIVVKGQHFPRRLQNPTRESIALGALQKHHGLRVEKFRAQSTPDEGEEEHTELLPEEDWTVPGGYQDSLSKNTKLGRALDDACSELDHLGKLEKESLQKATELLRKLGYKGDLAAPETKNTPADESSRN